MIEVEGEYVAYIDDDAQAYPDWVEKIASYIRRNRSIVAFGGPYYALSEIPLPDWFPPEYGSFDAGDKELLLNGSGYLFVREQIWCLTGKFLSRLVAFVRISGCKVKKYYMVKKHAYRLS